MNQKQIERALEIVIRLANTGDDFWWYEDDYGFCRCRFCDSVAPLDSITLVPPIQFHSLDCVFAPAKELVKELDGEEDER